MHLITRMNFKNLLLSAIFGLIFSVGLGAQNIVSATLKDSQNGEPLSFATVSLTKDAAAKVYKYVLSDSEGRVRIEGVRKGEYEIKAELLGYKVFTKKIKVEGNLSLGVIKIEADTQQLEGATITDVGNPILIKKDTIEYHAASFKTTENDVLEDLLKKLPGIEIAEDGSITSNGQTINKITIDGKTFFLDDPQLASKNIPAKLVEKVKVVNKKSEQAEFTGIDDGEEETVIDLSVKKGMLNGSFGNVSAGAGHDIPSSTAIVNDYRLQAAGFIGNFTEKRQISGIVNANNTNNRGFNDLSANMMGNMRGPGMGGRGPGNGIVTSYMVGANGAWNLFQDRMDLAGNYLYNHSDRDALSRSEKVSYLDGSNLISKNEGSSNNTSDGHRFGLRIDHVFNKNTSILFEPRIQFGSGSYSDESTYSTLTDKLDGNAPVTTNYGDSRGSGANKNFTASGFALLRQRLNKPGRTLTLMGRYSLSNNNLLSKNISNTYVNEVNSPIDQNIASESNSYSLWSRLTYTEPIAKNLFLEGNYSYSWSESNSTKNTYDNLSGGALDPVYSNEIINKNTQQNMGVNLMYQMNKSHAQIGFSARPVNTYNSTTRYNPEDGSYAPKEYTDFRWRFAPSAMLWWEFSDNASARLFYRGNSNQPSTNQLMPVPDNTDPLNVSFGNPSLKPYFSHSINGHFRYNNRKNFSSVSVRFNGSYTQDPIVSATWYNNGAACSIPMNGPDAANASVHSFANVPIGKSKFFVSNMLRASWSESSSYVGKNVDMSTYNTDGYYAFMDEFLKKWDKDELDFDVNTISTIGFTERLRLTYRTEDLELTASGRTRMNSSTYTLTDADATTWNNQFRFTVNWTWDQTGITIKSDGNYNWYRGYTTAQDDEYVLNAEIQKLLFKKKVTLALKCYDIFGQAKQLSVTDAANYHSENLSNTLGRYIICSLTYRFGNFDRSSMQRGPGGHGGFRH